MLRDQDGARWAANQLRIHHAFPLDGKAISSAQGIKNEQSFDDLYCEYATKIIFYRHYVQSTELRATVQRII